MKGEICKNCGCCSILVEDCYNCEDGYSHHECGEDSCCCLHPENNIKCDICNGDGFWNRCINDMCMDDGHPNDANHIGTGKENV